MDEPNDHLLKILGTFYKIGRFGYIFLWTEFGWVKSTKTPEDIDKEKAARVVINSHRRDRTIRIN